ncbi:alpha/beta hydrolase-fold protein [Kocuria sp.]|uniref:alpha/beta hydrolase-fold protein n=1 Tax=Kocuria sp. TaxID=1871328 RepID=UPI0026DBEF7D|nr:alpha/beta hydrolase-fold protein [Kocuria sp.]MDO4918693.1 alpha/beta hydrolase-fold protein [Kocuria sp.]
MTATPEQRRPPKVPRPTPVPRVTGPTVRGWERALAAGGAEARAVRDEIAAVLAGGTPLCEHEDVPAGEPSRRIVTFLFEDPHATDVLLFANRLTDESSLSECLMRRLPGTNVWHVGFRMRASWRASYCFLPVRPGQPAPWEVGGDHVRLRAALDRGVVDPRNPHTCPTQLGREMSVVALDRAPCSPWPVRPDPAAATPRWETADGGLRVTVQPVRAPGAAGEREAATVLVLDGQVWLAQGLVAAVRSAVADGALRPVTLVLVDSGGRDRRWAELDGTSGFEDRLADRFLPWLAAHHGVSRDPRRVAVVGQSLGGLTALLCALRRPDAVGRAVSQSASLWQRAPFDAVRAALAADDAAGLADTRIVAEVGEHEWVLTGPHDEFARVLAETPARLGLRRYDGGHDWACWRESLVPALVELFSGEGHAAAAECRA